MREVSSSSRGQTHTIEIEGTADEIDLIRGMLNGQHWLLGESGDGDQRYMHVHQARIAPPLPEEDPPIPTLFTLLDPKDPRIVDDIPQQPMGLSLPAILIQHLCGYSRSPENYTYQAITLRQAGFECLRSRRGLDGRFWEVWMLPYLESAQGELRDVLQDLPRAAPTEDKVRRAVSWLCANVSFGTLDVTVQRAAAVYD